MWSIWFRCVIDEQSVRRPDRETKRVWIFGKRPVRYMSATFRSKADRKLKNYFEMGFQNGGTLGFFTYMSIEFIHDFAIGTEY